MNDDKKPTQLEQLTMDVQERRHALVSSIGELKDGIEDVADWHRVVGRSPWKFLGAAVVIGWMLSRTTSR